MACYFHRERTTPHSNGSVTMNKRIRTALAVVFATLAIAGAAAGTATAASASTAAPAPSTLYHT